MSREYERVCCHCRFFDKTASFCRCNPPQIVETGYHNKHHSEWPRVNSYDWCGDFRKGPIS